MAAADSMILKAILQFDSGKAITNMGKASVGFARVQGQANRLKGGMSKLGGQAGKLALGFAPVTFGLGLAFNRAREFGKGVAEVATIADEAEFPINEIEKSTLSLAKTFGTVPVEQTKALYQGISAGATTATEATDLLTAANKLAVGGVSDTFTSVDVLTSALNAYEAQGLEATDATDTLFTAVRKGKTTVDELGASLGGVIPTASQLDISFSDLNAAVAAITLSGINTAEATTGLNSAFANVIKPSEDARKAAKALGIDFSSTALKTKGLTGFMGQIVEKAGGNEVALSKLFGSIRGVRAIMALTSNNAAIFNDVLGAMEDRAGATETAFQKMAKSTDFQMRKFMALRVIASTLLGQVLERGLLRIVSPLAGVTEGFVNILEAVKTGEFQGLGKTSASIAMGIRDGLDAVTSGINFIVGSLRSAKQWFTETFGEGSLRGVSKIITIFLVVAGALAPILLVLGGIGFILPAILGAVAALGTVFSATIGLILGPVGLMIAAVILFREQLWGVFTGLMEVAGPVFEDLKMIFWDVVSTVMQAVGIITGQFDESSNSAKTDWVELGRTIGAVLGVVLTTVASVAGFIVKLGAWGVIAFKVLGESIGKLGGIIVSLVMDPLRTLARGVIGFMELTGMEVPFTLKAYAGGGATPRASGRGLGGGGGRGLAERVNQFGREDARSAAEGKVAAEESKGALASVLDEVKNAANNTADSAAAAAAAAAKKPGVKVDLDGREVARSNAEAEEEIKSRSGFETTPWQRNQIAVHGSRPV